MSSGRGRPKLDDKNKKEFKKLLARLGVEEYEDLTFLQAYFNLSKCEIIRRSIRFMYESTVKNGLNHE